MAVGRVLCALAWPLMAVSAARSHGVRLALVNMAHMIQRLMGQFPGSAPVGRGVLPPLPGPSSLVVGAATYLGFLPLPKPFMQEHQAPSSFANQPRMIPAQIKLPAIALCDTNCTL